MGHHPVLSRVHQKGTESEVEQPGLEQEPTRNGGIVGYGFTHYTTLPALPVLALYSISG